MKITVELDTDEMTVDYIIRLCEKLGCNIKYPDVNDPNNRGMETFNEYEKNLRGWLEENYKDVELRVWRDLFPSPLHFKNPSEKIVLRRKKDEIIKG